MSHVAERESTSAGFKTGSVSGIEVLAQSVSEIAPSAVVGAVVVLVVGASGPASWVTWLVGGAVLLLVAFVLTHLTSRYGSPGGLYTLVARAGGRPLGYFTAWMAVISYVGGAIAVVYQISEFATGFLNLPTIGLPYNALTTAVVALIGLTAGAWCSYSNAQASARTMLITESISVGLITILMFLVLIKHHGPIVDPFEFKGLSVHGVVLGIPLVLFSFAGFESSTAFAREAKNPRRAISLALMGSVAIAALFFIFCSYVLVLAFHGTKYDIVTLPNVLATVTSIVGVSWYAYIVDVGVIFSMFAVIVALINTSSRLLYTLSSESLGPKWFAQLHPKRGTPANAIRFVWVVCVVGIAVVAIIRASVLNAFGNMGTLSGDAQGILYLFAVVAVVIMIIKARSRATRHSLLALTAAILATAAIAFLLYKSFVPLPTFPTSVFVYILFGILVLSLVLFPVVAASRRTGRLQQLGSSVVEYDVDAGVADGQHRGDDTNDASGGKD
jgi:amino acid transporter